MELHQLRYLCAIADTGSFSRAAEHCHVAQPSLSQQISKLEDELGARLFDRLGRSIRLTDAGRAFLPHARTVLHQTELARSEVDGRRRDARGTVTVGVIPTIAPYYMPKRIAAFARRYPDATLRIVEETTPDLVESLRSLAVDVAILSLPLRHRDFDIAPLLTERLYAALPPGHPRAAAASLSLRELRDDRFVLLRDSHCFRGIALDACLRARLDPRIVFESGQFSSLLGMVAAGVGVTLVPEMAIDRGAGCRYVPVSDAQASRTIATARLRGRSFSRVQQAFLQQLTKKDVSRSGAPRVRQARD
ncbi:MAG TPA: LysR substrate-binding domain-containing protein [Acidobacteriaceae bacterium]|jgi:LysR family transcriptional regulator, hydrogen peroxide-inducible genes activator|nr:LysR substrate-binding domain-containing protein [Acidobacteriaceae bacterium]